ADGQPVKYGKAWTFVMPFLVIAGPGRVFGFVVPVDDTRTILYSIMGWVADDRLRKKWVDWQAGPASAYEDGRYGFTERERGGQDRSRMGKSFPGIEGVAPEDFAVTLSMGPIYDRTRENLVLPADRMVIALRRRLLEAARDLEGGVEPHHLESEEA